MHFFTAELFSMREPSCFFMMISIFHLSLHLLGPTSMLFPSKFYFELSKGNGVLRDYAPLDQWHGCCTAPHHAQFLPCTSLNILQRGCALHTTTQKAHQLRWPANIERNSNKNVTQWFIASFTFRLRQIYIFDRWFIASFTFRFFYTL